MKVPYNYSLVRYVHDPIAGEVLNVGVILYSPTVPFLDAKLEFRYERFSSAFAQFDGERFKQVLRHFSSAVDEARESLSAAPLFIRDSNASTTSTDIARRIWIDAGLSFRVSEPMGGAGENMPALLEELFDRFVTSQYPRQESQHMTDEQVWTRYRGKLPNEVKRNLRTKSFETPDYTIEFEHAFQNERWHVLQPVSMDYAKTASIQDKATKWLGAAMNLRESPEAAKGKFYFLLHPPELESQQQAYIRAKNIFHKMPLDHEFFEETETARLSEELLAHLGAREG